MIYNKNVIIPELIWTVLNESKDISDGILKVDQFIYDKFINGKEDIIKEYIPVRFIAIKKNGTVPFKSIVSNNKLNTLMEKGIHGKFQCYSKNTYLSGNDVTIIAGTYKGNYLKIVYDFKQSSKLDKYILENANLSFGTQVYIIKK